MVESVTTPLMPNMLVRRRAVISWHASWNTECHTPAERLECRLTAPLSEAVANRDAPHASAVPFTVPSSTLRSRHRRVRRSQVYTVPSPPAGQRTGLRLKLRHPQCLLRQWPVGPFWDLSTC